MKTVRLSLDAINDVGVAHAWYCEQRAELGEGFLVEFENVLALVSRQPNSYQVVYRGLRRALMRRFPYGVYFRDDAEVVDVVAVFHARRNPRTLTSR